MHFDHDFGIISSLVKIDTTIQPLQGGTINVLDVVGTGGIKLPAGDTTARVGTTGIVRYNSDLGGVEFFDGTNWQIVRDNGSVTATITQTAHGFSVMQLLEYDTVGNTFKSVNDLAATAGVVTQVIDANTFVLTLYGLITGWPTTFDGFIHFWYRDITTNAITTASCDTDISANYAPMLYASMSPSVPIIVPVRKQGATAYGCFIPSSPMFTRPYLSYNFESPAPPSPRLRSITGDVADPVSPVTLARYVTILSSSVYTMPSWYLSVSVDMTRLSYNSISDIMMTVVVQLLPQPVDATAQSDNTPGYLSDTGSVTWAAPTSGIKQVVGFTTAGAFYYIAPYTEQATAGSVYISNSAPSVTPGIPYMWVQTGLNTDGKGMTFWIEDGVI